MTSTQSRPGLITQTAPGSPSQPAQQHRFPPFRAAGLPGLADCGDADSDSAFARLSFTAAAPGRAAAIHLELKGDIDLSHVVLLEDTLDQVTAFPACPVTVDLSAVTFLGSHGVSFLAALHRHTGRGGHRITVTGAAPIVRRVLELCGFDQILTVIPAG